ncbi:MAG: hypothetical protein WC505_01680 [Patescibacteria group bacterium]
MPDVSTVWLRANYYALSHRNELKKWWVIVLLAVAVFCVVFVITNITVYIIGIPQQTSTMVAMASSQVAYGKIRIENQPVNPSVGAATAVQMTTGAYDLIVPVHNPNRNWAINEIAYKFTVNATETEVATDFIMPNSRKILTVRNVQSPFSPSQIAVTVSIESISWKRIDNVAALPSLDFTIENIKQSMSNVGGIPYYLVTADVTNNSFTSFWSTKFVTLLYSGDAIVGVHYTYLEPFNTSEKKSIYAQFDSVQTSVTSVSIEPDINLLDTENIVSR